MKHRLGFAAPYRSLAKLQAVAGLDSGNHKNSGVPCLVAGAILHEVRGSHIDIPPWRILCDDIDLCARRWARAVHTVDPVAMAQADTVDTCRGDLLQGTPQVIRLGTLSLISLDITAKELARLR